MAVNMVQDGFYTIRPVIAIEIDQESVRFTQWHSEEGIFERRMPWLDVIESQVCPSGLRDHLQFAVTVDRDDRT